MQVVRLKRIAGGIFLLVLIVASVYIIRHDGGRPYITLGGEAFSTTWTVVYQPRKANDGLEDLVLRALEQVDLSLSAFNEESVLSRVNRGETCELDSLLCACLNLSLQIAEATGGAFDPTVGSLVDHYGFGAEERADTEGLAEIVGYTKLKIDGDTIDFLGEPAAKLDLSAVAKGMAVDVVSRVLDGAGIENYLVEIGGEIRCKGASPSTEYWTVGIVRPQRGETGVFVNIAVTNVSIATSGNYRNYKEQGDTIVGHILDPRTLGPSRSRTISATVLAADCATADAWATALMVMQPEETSALLPRHDELQALIVYTDSMGEEYIWSTDELQELIVSINN